MEIRHQQRQQQKRLRRFVCRGWVWKRSNQLMGNSWNMETFFFLSVDIPQRCPPSACVCVCFWSRHPRANPSSSSTSSDREFAKQLVAMVAVCLPPISGELSWGPEGGYASRVWQIAALWGEIRIHWTTDSKSFFKYISNSWNNGGLLHFLSCA